MQLQSMSVQQNEGMAAAHASAASWITQAHIIVKKQWKF